MREGAWWDGPLVGLDLETTAPDPEEARIVTAALVTVGPNAEPGNLRRGVERRTWLADPGVPIPEEATAVHGITTEHARAEGWKARSVIEDVLVSLGDRHADAPVIVFNARYDLTVLDREARRHGLDPAEWAPGPVVDPFVLDKHLDRYRKSYPPGFDAESAKAAGVPSSRTLEGMCTHYRATLDGAHDAAFDALAAVRLAWRICSSAEPVRRVRNQREAAELYELAREWTAARFDLEALHEYQRELALAERARFAEYKRSIGEHEEAARIEREVGWPVLEAVTS